MAIPFDFEKFPDFSVEVIEGKEVWRYKGEVLDKKPILASFGKGKTEVWVGTKVIKEKLPDFDFKRFPDFSRVVIFGNTYVWRYNDKIISSPEYDDENKYWYWVNKKGNFHSFGDCPGVISLDGQVEWYKDGELHRENGPALIAANGEGYWFKDGRQLIPFDWHRFPAFLVQKGDDGKEVWYYNGVEIPSPSVGKFRDLIWRNDKGQVHSFNDCPAWIESADSMYWYKHGKLHRDNDNPAWVCGDQKCWYRHGRLHRDDDKPALALISKERNEYQWYIRGVKHRVNGPAVISNNLKTGFRLEEWYFEGKLHREKCPAVSYGSGLKEWWTHGKLILKDHNGKKRLGEDIYQKIEVSEVKNGMNEVFGEHEVEEDEIPELT